MRRPCARILVHKAPVGADQQAPLGLAERGEVAR